MYQSLSNIIINLQANKDLLLQQDNEVDRIKSILPLVVARNSIIETLGRNPVWGISLTDDVNNLKIDNQLVTEVIPRLIGTTKHCTYATLVAWKVVIVLVRWE